MALEDLKHAQRQRLVFLDRCLTFRGLANRRDLMAAFGISPAQAALDFRLYLARALTPPTYDAARKTYVAAVPHAPLAPASLLEAFDILSPDAVEPSARLPQPARVADPAVVAQLHQALREGVAIEILYTSMTSGAGEAQYIAPTQFTSDGESVHLRAYSFRHADYRSYLPIRIGPASSFATRPLAAPLPFDVDWHTLAHITLRPRSDLSPAQADVVRREYGFEGAELTLTTRKALEFYLDHRWGLDHDAARLERVATRYEAPQDVPA